MTRCLTAVTAELGNGLLPSSVGTFRIVAASIKEASFTGPPADELAPFTPFPLTDSAFSTYFI